MRRLLACALLLAGCKTPLPRPMPSAEWMRSSAVYVSFDPGRDSNGLASATVAPVQSELRLAGFRLADAPSRQGELDVTLAAPSDAQIDAEAAKDGAPVDQISVNFGVFGDVPCGGGHFDAKCIGREIVVRLLSSPKVAAAMSRGAAPAVAGPHRLSGKLAVLELRNFTKDLTKENAQYFTDVVRSAALKAQPQLEVMTRENLVVLLKSTGKSLDECEGECEVDTGRRIGADEIVSGEIQKLGSLYKLSLRLHDTHEGRLLASTQASGHTIEELDQSAQKAADDLLK